MHHSLLYVLLVVEKLEVVLSKSVRHELVVVPKVLISAPLKVVRELQLESQVF